MAARGSPPAAIGLNCNRICSLPKLALQNPFLLHSSRWRSRGRRRFRGWRRRRRRLAVVWAALPPASRSLAAALGGTVGAVGLQLLPLFGRQLGANGKQKAGIRLFQLGPRLRHL